MDGPYVVLQHHLYISDPGEGTRDRQDSPEARLAKLVAAGLTAETEHLKVRLKLDGRCLQLSHEDLALVEKHFPTFVGSGPYVGEVPEDVLDYVVEVTGLEVFSSIGYLVAPDGETIAIGTAGPFAKTDEPVQYAIAQWGPKITTIEKLRAAVVPAGPPPIVLASGARLKLSHMGLANAMLGAPWVFIYVVNGVKAGLLDVALAVAINLFGIATKRYPKCQSLAVGLIWVLAAVSIVVALIDIRMSGR